jgi:hypothetical protein
MTIEKIQTVTASIQLLLQDQVEQTQILRALDIIKNFTMDAVNNMMTPAGFHEFTQGLHATPTTFRYSSYSHGSNIEYDYIL